MHQKFINTLYISFIIILISLTTSSAEDLKSVGKFKDWETFAVMENNNKICFAQSIPILRAPKKYERNPSSKLIEIHTFSAGCSSANATHSTHSTSYTINEVDCLFNDVQHIINGDEVTAANDYSFAKGKIDTLDGLVSYRDPLLEVDGGGEYDAAKKTAAETFDTAISDCKAEFDDLDTYHGQNYDGRTYSKTDATALADELDACNADISTRLTELNARIGNPTYSGGQSSNGTEPGIRVSALPAKASGTLVPYGITIYEAVNVALGDDIGLINEVVAEADSLQFKYKEVRDKRNEYDMLKGRSKYYGN